MNASILTLIRKFFVFFLIWSHANSCKVAQSRVKSVYFRTSWAVMGKSRKSLLFPNFSPKLPAKSCQVFGSHGQSCQVRGIPRTKGGYIHTHNSVCYSKFKILFKKFNQKYGKLIIN